MADGTEQRARTEYLLKQIEAALADADQLDLSWVGIDLSNARNKLLVELGRKPEQD